ncbi:MAG: hypothetical protein ACRELY_14360 [Polyangiaceae bacterium]
MNADAQTQAMMALAEAKKAARAMAIGAAHVAASRAWAAAHRAGNISLALEVERFEAALDAPIARMMNGDELSLAGVAEKIRAPRALVLDGRLGAVFSKGKLVVDLASRPLAFDLLAALAENAPSDVLARDLARVVLGAKSPRASHELRVRRQFSRLRVLAKNKLGKLIYGDRKLRWESPVKPLLLVPIAPRIEARLEALLSDGRARASRALAVALNESRGAVEAALISLESRGVVERLGKGTSLRWKLRVAELRPLLR